MADFVFNVGKGKTARYADLIAANDALIMIPVESSGVQSDATLIDLDTVSALFAGATNEQTTLGRKTLTTVAVTIDDTNDRVDVDCDDVTWTASAGNAVSDVAITTDLDTTAGDDTNIIPLTFHDFAFTPDGSDVTAQVPTGGFYRAS